MPLTMQRKSAILLFICTIELRGSAVRLRSITHLAKEDLDLFQLSESQAQEIADKMMLDS